MVKHQKGLEGKQFTYLLANPQEISSNDVAELRRMVDKFPYFQSARALLLKGLKNQNSLYYNEALKITAAYTSDRNILFEYITSDDFIQNAVSREILIQEESLREISVEIDDVSESVKEEEKEKFKLEQKKADAILNPDLFQRKKESVEEMVSNKDSEPEDILINQPLEFRKEDTFSFSQWLQLTKMKKIDRSEETTESDEVLSERKRKSELIDRFIEENPRITTSRSLADSGSKEIPEMYSPSQESLMTETLARVYLQQKNYLKAIQAYKILILKYPEKSGFFADQIRAIEKLNK